MSIVLKDKPLAARYGFVGVRGGAVFYVDGEAVEIEGAQGAIWEMLRQCMGTATWEEIIDALQSMYEKDSLVKLAEALCCYGIVVNASEAFPAYHNLTCNPRNEGLYCTSFRGIRGFIREITS